MVVERGEILLVVGVGLWGRKVGGGPLLSLNSDDDGRESLRWFVYVGLQIWVMRRVWDLGGVNDDCCSVFIREKKKSYLLFLLQ
jgi:hypothetical protein